MGSFSYKCDILILDMRKINRIIFSGLISIMGMVSLSSCGLIETGDINQFTGEYITNTGTETVKHYYWGQTTTKSENTILESGHTVVIYPNKKVLFRYKGQGDIVNGRVRVYSDHITFSGISSINSSYQFKLRDDHSLAYSYHEDKYGLEYDYTVRQASMSYRGPADDYNPSSQSQDLGAIQIERDAERYQVTNPNLVFVDNSAHFKITGTNYQGQPISPSSIQVSWSINDTSVAKVDYQGVVTALKEGTCTLTAQYGIYSNTFEINTAIIARKFETGDLEDEYRSGNTYNLPFTPSPFNATVKYSTDDSNVLFLNPDKKTFKVLASGSATINAEYYPNNTGVSQVTSVNIICVDAKAPTFKYNDRVVTSLSLEVAKNKYSVLNPNELGIYAYDNSNNDISNYIFVDQGEYDLSTVGTHNLVLGATDSSGRTSYLKITLEVTEYEVRKYNNVVDGIVEVSHKYTPIEIQYSQAIKQIKFEMDIKINDSYDTADVEIRWLIYFKIKRWDDNLYIDHSEDPIKIEDYKFVRDGPTELHLEYLYSSSNYLDPKTLTGLYTYANGPGTWYKYVTY